MSQPARRQFIAGTLLLASSITIGMLVDRVGAPAFDAIVVESTQQWRDGIVGAVMRAASAVGYARWLVPITTIVALAFLATGRRREAVVVALSTALSTVVTQVLKATFERPRPELAEYVVPGYSMPSGHATSSAAFAVSIALCVSGRFATAIRVALAAFAFLVGASRVVLGVHFPTDVLAGWCTGAGVALLVSAVVLNRRPSGDVE